MQKRQASLAQRAQRLLFRDEVEFRTTCPLASRPTLLHPQQLFRRSPGVWASTQHTSAGAQPSWDRPGSGSLPATAGECDHCLPRELHFNDTALPSRRLEGVIAGGPAVFKSRQVSQLLWGRASLWTWRDPVSTIIIYSAPDWVIWGNSGPPSSLIKLC